jgi:hypothetical protein
MVEAMGLKLWNEGHLQWHALSTEFHENLAIGSMGEGHTDRR